MIPHHQFIDPWIPSTMEVALHKIADEFNRVHRRLDQLEDFVRYVDETAPELRTAYQVSKRIE